MRSFQKTFPPEDIQYHIYIRQKIHRGLQAARSGKVISQEEAENRMAREVVWTEPAWQDMEAAADFINRGVAAAVTYGNAKSANVVAFSASGERAVVVEPFLKRGGKSRIRS